MRAVKCQNDEKRQKGIIVMLKKCICYLTGFALSHFNVVSLFHSKNSKIRVQLWPIRKQKIYTEYPRMNGKSNVKRTLRSQINMI